MARICSSGCSQVRRKSFWKRLLFRPWNSASDSRMAAEGMAWLLSLRGQKWISAWNVGAEVVWLGFVAVEPGTGIGVGLPNLWYQSS